LELKRLIKRCAKNDRKAQQKLYVLYKDVLYGLCLKYCKNKQEAEDNLQESFITIFKKIETYKSKGSFEGWMKRITINKALDRYKKQPYIDQVIEDKLEAEDTQINQNQMTLSLQEMLALVQELPDRYRLVFNLYQLDDYSHKEISDMLAITIGTSKSNLHRAKIILKEKALAQLALNQNTIVNGN